jgi:hypothetical protein
MKFFYSLNYGFIIGFCLGVITFESLYLGSGFFK